MFEAFNTPEGPSGRRTRGRQQAFLEAFVQELGIVQPACARAGISRQTHYNWLRDDPTYGAWFEMASKAAAEAQVQFVRVKFMERVRAGSSKAEQFCLREYGPEVLKRIQAGENPELKSLLQ